MEFALLKSNPEKIDKNRKSAEDFQSLIQTKMNLNMLCLNFTYPV